MSIFGLGNPLLDVSVNATDELLAKYELTCPNAILAEDKHIPLYDEIRQESAKPVYTAGGSCQNSIRVAQWMLNTPGATGFTGCVGTDAPAETLSKCIKADGVTPYYVHRSDLRTGCCAVLIKDNDRSMVTDLQAASSFKLEDLAASTEAAAKADIVLVEGYFLTVSQDSVVALAKQQMAKGKTFAFSLSAPFICQFFTEGVKAVMEYTDLVFGNETEAELVAQALGWDLGTDHVAIAKKLAAYPFAEGVKANRKVVITRGAQDVVVATADVATTYPVPLIPKEEMVDTNAAGDSWSGGFIAALAKGKSDEVCVKAGNYAAGYIIRRDGCSLETPSTFEF